MIPKFSVKKPLTVFVIALAVVILGVVSYMKMTPDLMPNMDFPYVIVVTSDPGASPESIEQEITRPIEESMATLDHIKSVTSTSQNSVSMVVLEFENGTDMNALSLDIQQKLTALEGGWDETVSTPYTMKINPSMLPVMVAAISYDGKGVEELSDFVNEELEQKLTGISGVASVDISGTLERQMHVVLDGEKLDKVSAEMLVEAEKLLDDAEKTLNDARKQVVEAQDMISEAKEGMADSAAGEIAGAASSAGDVLDEVQKYDPEDFNPDNFDPDDFLPEEEQLPLLGTKEFEALSKKEQLASLVAEGNAAEATIAANNATIESNKATIENNNDEVIPALKAELNELDKDIEKNTADRLTKQDALRDPNASDEEKATLLTELDALNDQRNTLVAERAAVSAELQGVESANKQMQEAIDTTLPTQNQQLMIYLAINKSAREVMERKLFF